MAAASALAFVVSETIDAFIYAWLMRRRSRALAMIGSNVAGLAVDSVVFVAGTLSAGLGLILVVAVMTAG
ncbi:VUT family protein [Amycolatopsis sp. FBCC-B4732]|uniref:VUT family protein n=1 Tax=Amycolatopsis sp. FBCC-B4732 TaxID=3079339 RepID=UPI001FF6EB4D|nr:VUT family protein [Amycolatopsis sp. FBCC-B4732]UOX88430.1 VUT family protein [Amycolatopsis sp. FBCC-B4732]